MMIASKHEADGRLAFEAILFKIMGSTCTCSRAQYSPDTRYSVLELVASLPGCTCPSARHRPVRTRTRKLRNVIRQF
jgi:hypothetical protein